MNPLTSYKLLLLHFPEQTAQHHKLRLSVRTVGREPKPFASKIEDVIAQWSVTFGWATSKMH